MSYEVVLTAGKDSLREIPVTEFTSDEQFTSLTEAAKVAESFDSFLGVEPDVIEVTEDGYRRPVRPWRERDRMQAEWEADQ